MCRSYSELLPYVAARSFFRTGRICWTARSMVCGVLHAKCFRDWMYSPCSPTINNVGIGAACGPTGVHTRTRLCTTMSLTSRAGQASQMLSVMTSVSMSNHNYTFSLDERPHVLHLIILQSEKSHFCSVSNDAAASFMDIYTLVELKIRPS